MPDTVPQQRCVALLMGDIPDVQDTWVALTSCSRAVYHDYCPSRATGLDALRSEARRSKAGAALDLPLAPGAVGRLVQPATALSTGYRR
jgi:hypothetical protein